MKNILTLALIFTFGLSYSQSEKETSEIKNDSIFFGNCKSGTERALNDAENGTYKYISYGARFITDDEEKFNEFYQKHMKTKYGILISNAGCVVSEDSKCYKKKIKELIFAEFGNDIFESSRIDAKKKYNKSE